MFLKKIHFKKEKILLIKLDLKIDNQKLNLKENKIKNFHK